MAIPESFPNGVQKSGALPWLSCSGCCHELRDEMMLERDLMVLGTGIYVYKRCRFVEADCHDQIHFPR